MNKDLFLDGRQYISASRAAKKLGYASDYIGQLAREGKIPSKMIGRTWYVDLEALLLHKTSHKGKRRVSRKAFRFDNQASSVRSVESAPQTILIDNRAKAPELVYEHEEGPKLPSLSKEKPVSKHPLVLRNVVVIAISLLVVMNTSLGWIEYVSPRTAAIIHTEIATVAEEIDGQVIAMKIAAESASAPFGYAEEKSAEYLLGAASGAKSSLSRFFQKIFAQEGSDRSGSEVGSGMVVIPEESNHAQAVTRVKNAFSDDVRVHFDEDGDSGVITPEFRSGNGDEYIFVLVPIDGNTEAAQ